MEDNQMPGAAPSASSPASNKMPKALMALVAVGLIAGAVVWSLSGNDAEKLAMSEPEPQAAPPSAVPESGATGAAGTMPAGTPMPAGDDMVGGDAVVGEPGMMPGPGAPAPGFVPDEGVAMPADSEGYRNGTYNATGVYTSPAQQEEVKLTLTIEGGVVVASEFEADSPNKISQRLQGMFAEGYQAEVIGKSLDEIDLDVVNGSSLTPKGFMDALDKIKAEARS
jgi:uncharacterized protein with FMN-binding domain